LIFFVCSIDFKIVLLENIKHRTFLKIIPPCCIQVRKVVLPLPGSITLFPREEVGALYRRLLSYDGVSLEGSFLEVSSGRDQCPLEMLGSYRRCVCIYIDR